MAERSVNRNIFYVLLDRYCKTYTEVIPAHQIFQIRLVIGCLLVYKLLSRDFSNIAYWSESLLSSSPFSIYSPIDYVLVTGINPIFDIVSLHFVHWILPYPTGETFKLLQYSACILAILFVMKASWSRWIAIGLTLILAYLWGFVYRLGQDIDSMFLVTGALFCFMFYPGQVKEEGAEKKMARESHLYSSILMIFILYYFFSGFNKIIDLSPMDWFSYEVVNINASFVQSYEVLGYLWVPRLDFFGFDFLKGPLQIFGAVFTYFWHLTAPFMFFKRKNIIWYWMFYSLFHLLTGFVGILFASNFIVWLCVLQVRRAENG